jgi:feruloyl esterase
MKLEPLFRMRVQLGKRYPIGLGPKGRRNVWTLSGGEFEGPRLRGAVAPVGGEFELIDAEGVCHIDVRLVLVTDDRANIFVQYFGIAATPPDVAKRFASGAEWEFGDGYFVTQPRFETAHPSYSWLNHTMAVAEGRGVPGGVEYLIYRCEPDATIGVTGMAGRFAHAGAPHG